MVKFAVLLIVFLNAMQAVDSRPNRFGAIGRALTDAEVGQITDLANAAGQPPWLLLGFPSMLSGVVTMSLYLAPDVATAPVRRGRVLTLEADEPPTVRERSFWKVKGTGPYAYIAAAGHQPGTIIDERDISWPFATQGDIDDETLISVVAFIRSRPAIPGVPAGVGPRNVSGSPITAVARKGDDLVIALRTSDATGERVTVSFATGQWAVTHFEWWIV